MTTQESYPQGPNFLIAGAARSGTTALARSLQAHPEIFFTEPKEVHFFAHANAPVRYRGPGDDAMMNRPQISDEAAFLGLFAGVTEPRRGEGSVSSLYFAQRSVPEMVRVCGPELKVIVVLREPAERARSAYLYLRSREHETCETFAEGLAQEQKRIAEGYHHMWHYRSMSEYHTQLPYFAEAFGDNLHVVLFEEYRADPTGEIERICRFLDVEPSGDLAITSAVNTGGIPRSALLASVINRARSLPMVASLVKSITTPAFRDQLRARNLERPEPDSEMMTTLRADLLPAVEAVEELLGRPLPAWRS